MRWCVLAVATAALVLTAGALGQAFGVRVDGKALAELAPANAKAVVLYFVASDCPVSNRTMPEMLRVKQEFAARGVAFRFVYPNTYETPVKVKQHLASFGPGLSAEKDTVLDATGRLVALTHVRVTPEVAVLVREDSGWKTVYTGRIDNRYERLGVERPQATEHYAERVVSEVLAGRAAQMASFGKTVATPVGCAIVNPQAPAMESEKR
jgi:thiol-disulfide isomerase/thioredoxin